MDLFETVARIMVILWALIVCGAFPVLMTNMHRKVKKQARDIEALAGRISSLERVNRMYEAEHGAAE